MREVKKTKPELANMPVSFGGVLDYILEKAKRLEIRSHISKLKVESENVPQDIDHYCTLFSQEFIEKPIKEEHSDTSSAISSEDSIALSISK